MVSSSTVYICCSWQRVKVIILRQTSPLTGSARDLEGLNEQSNKFNFCLRFSIYTIPLKFYVSCRDRDTEAKRGEERKYVRERERERERERGGGGVKVGKRASQGVGFG